MSTPIPQSNPGAGYRALRTEIDAAVHRVLDSGWYILGPEVERFEKAFATYTGVAHALGVGNGTDALELALRAAGIGAGDVVFTVGHTAVATVAAIELAGATPCLVDIDPETCVMDPVRLDAAIAAVRDGMGGGRRPAAVIPVHLYGQMVDMPAVMALAERHGLKVIEDCAQAHGAAWAGRRAGTWGDLAAFSFYPTKNLGALGDGGAVVTSDSGLAERVRLLREYGWARRYVSDLPGKNSRLDVVQAAILEVRLRHLDAENGRRRQLAAIYDGAVPGGRAWRVRTRPEAHHVYHQYVIRSAGRDAIREQLSKAGIGTLVHYPVPVHRQPAYEGRILVAGEGAGLPATERAAAEVLSLPMFPQLGDDEARRVVRALEGAAG